MSTSPHSGSKRRPAEEAIRLVRPGTTLAVGGAGGVQEPDLLIETLAAAYRRDGTPGGLTEFHPIRCGEIDGRGTSLFGAKGFVRRMIGGSFWPVGVPELIRRIHDNEIAAWNFSIGVMYALLEAAAAGRPGVVTTAGLETFVDPRQEGGALNDAARSEPLVELALIGGREMLFYRAIPVDVAFIRATTADEAGNLTLEEEPASCGTLVLAQAAKANGGKVIAQVKRVVPTGTLDPRDVRVPGILVDAVVEHPSQRQITHVDYDPTLVGAARLPLESVPRRPFDSQKTVMRRAFLEARPGQILAIGFGVAGYLPAIAIEEGVLERVTFTIEHGPVGGINGYAAGGRTFPVTHNPEAIVDAADQLRYYAGGAIDCAFLGVGEVDRRGHVNVSRFGDRIPGAGGFIEMTQGIGKIVYCFTLGDKGARKVVERVQQITFNADRARRTGQDITYVTEKAVFRLTDRGLTLTELAPGLTPAEVQAGLGTEVALAENLRPMPEACFHEPPMGLATLWNRTG